MGGTQTRKNGTEGSGGPEAGEAYRCADGIVRWVTHLSRRGYFHLLWLEEERGVWFDGGRMKRGDATFEGAEPHPAPQPGETYVKIGVYGTPRECRVEDREGER